MFTEHALLRYLGKITAALLMFLFITIVGVIATGYQIRKNTIHIARDTIRQVDLLLDNADITAVQASAYLTMPCTAKIRSELSRLAINGAHVRVISLLKEEQLICSSFSTSTPRKVDTSQYAGHRLSLRPGSIITPDSPLLILLKTMPKGTVSVSIGAPHLVAILSLLGTRTELTLQVGNLALSSQGYILAVSAQNYSHRIYSTSYPYSVFYNEPEILPLGLLLERAKVLLLLFVFLGVMGGALVFRLIFRLPTAYDQLVRAIRRKEIVPWYQPVICTRTGVIYGVEVLARWKLSSGVYVPPDVFIPLAEKSGMIVLLTRLLMSQVATDLVPVIQRVRQPFHIAFNISAAHIRIGKILIEDFQQLLAQFPENSVQLVAEITERESFEPSSDLNELLLSLHKQGIQVALDDFGTGYSNLNYLNTLPIDYIKIDRSFVCRLTEEAGSDKLLGCVISMARTLELGIVAEGVESHYQVAWLAAHHVDYLQGYYFSRPLPASALVRLTVLQGKNFHLDVNS